MNLYQLAFRNISGNRFRSSVVGLCALLIAGLALATTLIMRGAEKSLRLAIDRLGADIIVVPEGTQTKVESALLMGNPTEVWMSAANEERIAAIPGVQAVSPQLYLSTLTGASCCSVEHMFIIAYNPLTDFAVEPWLKDTLGDGLHLGEVVGGTYVFVPEGQQNIKIYGYFVTLRTNMEPTGTGLDQSMFMTFETAYDVARISLTRAESPLEIPEDSISAVLVKVAPGSDTSAIALQIMHEVPGVTPIESPDMFQAYRQQMAGLRAGVLVAMSTTLVLSLVLIGLVFSMAANERRRELGVLRAMGATHAFVFQSLLAEAVLLAMSGGAVGIGFTALTVYLFRHLLIVSMHVPFLLPTPQVLLLYMLGGLGLALGSVTVAALWPAYRISHQDPSTAMRE